MMGVSVIHSSEAWMYAALASSTQPAHAHVLLPQSGSLRWPGTPALST